jgi:hypothetical protein
VRDPDGAVARMPILVGGRLGAWKGHTQ